MKTQSDTPVTGEMDTYDATHLNMSTLFASKQGRTECLTLQAFAADPISSVMLTVAFGLRTSVQPENRRGQIQYPYR